MANTVYVVTSGWSSDYRIEGIFSTKENAEKYVSVFGEKDITFSIDEWDIDEYYNNKIREYVVHIQFDNSYVTRIQEKNWDINSLPSNSIKGRIIAGTRLVTMTFSTDKIDTIKKIASERLMHIKALQDIKFPYLFRKVVLCSCNTLLNISENVRNKDFPIYDFNTGHIWLEESQTLKTGIKAKTETIQR